MKELINLDQETVGAKAKGIFMSRSPEKLKKRSPKLTRLEKLTKGLAADSHKHRSRFSIYDVKDKGRSLFLHKGIIKRDSFVIEYEGDLITHSEAEMREKTYELNKEGCYILFFKFRDQKLAIDATRKFKSYARYLSHSRTPNIKFHTPIVVDLNGENVPRIAAYALRDIHEGEEIVFDYGVRDSGISWLQSKEMTHMSELPSSSESENGESDEESESDAAEISLYKTGITRSHPSLPPRPTALAASTSHSHSAATSSFEQLPVSPNGYAMRFMPMFSPLSTSPSYVVNFESLPEPRKIHRSIDNNRDYEIQCAKVSADYPSEESQQSSVISLSCSEANSNHEAGCSSIAIDLKSELPTNNIPTSKSKVMGWQCQNSPLSNDGQSELKILNVKSMVADQHTSKSSTVSCHSNDQIQSSDVFYPKGDLKRTTTRLAAQGMVAVAENSSDDCFSINEGKLDEGDFSELPTKVPKITEFHSVDFEQIEISSSSAPSESDLDEKDFESETKAGIIQMDEGSDFSKSGKPSIIAQEHIKAERPVPIPNSLLYAQPIISSIQTCQRPLKEEVYRCGGRVVPKRPFAVQDQSSCVVSHSSKLATPASQSEIIIPNDFQSHFSRPGETAASSSSTISQSHSSTPGTVTAVPKTLGIEIQSDCGASHSWKSKTPAAAASPEIIILDDSESHPSPTDETISSPAAVSSSGTSAICQSHSSPPVAVIKPYYHDESDVKINEEEKKKLIEILGPHVWCGNTQTEQIRTALSRNWEFFRNLTRRGITITDIKAVIRKVTKAIEKDRRKTRGGSDQDTDSNVVTID